jgi:hypothetical protein
MFGFRACSFQHVSLASGRTVFSSCGADPSKAKKRLSAPMGREKRKIASLPLLLGDDSHFFALL